MTRRGMTTVNLAGIVSHGAPIATINAESIEVPADKIERRELLYRVGRLTLEDLGVREGDLLIVEPREDSHSATPEFVVATIDERVFLGRWWRKHGRRAVMNESLEPIVEDSRLRVLGVVTVIMRAGPQRA